MANLQQCLLHYSVQPPQPRRRRRKRNKGRKAMTPLNNSIIQELRRQRSTTGSNVNSNLIKLGIPGESIVKAGIKESEPKPTIEKTAPKPIAEKSALKPTVVNLEVEPTIEKSPLKPTFVNSAVKPTIEKSPPKPILDRSVLQPIVEKLALKRKLMNSAVKPTIKKSPPKPTVVNLEVEPTTEKSPLKPTFVNSAVKPTIEKSPSKPTVDRSVLQPIVEKLALKRKLMNSAVKPTIEKSPPKPTVVNLEVEPTTEKSLLKPTVVNSAVKPTIEKSPPKPTVDRSVLQPIVEKLALKRKLMNSAVKPTIEKSPPKPTVVKLEVEPTTEKSLLKPTVVNSAVKPAIEKSPPKPSVDRSVLQPIVEKLALKRKLMNSAVKPTIEKSPPKPTVVNSAVKSTIKKSPLKPTVETSTANSTIGKLTINPEFQKLTASQSFKTSLVNQTIDLSSDESSNEAFNWTYSGDNKPCMRSKQEENLIDLSEDVPDENEIILLNDYSKSSEGNCPKITPSENTSHDTCSPDAKPASNKPLKCELLYSRSENKSLISKSPERKRLCITPPLYEQPKTKPASSSPPVNGSETVVIDISDDENENDVDLSVKDDTNDEILVIGTFNKTSKPKARSIKKVPKKVHTKPIRNRVKKLLDIPTQHPRGNPREGYSRIARRQQAFNVGETSSGNFNSGLIKLRRRIKAKYFSRILQHKKKMEINLLDTIRYQHIFLNNTLSGTELSSGIGGNVYINAPVYIPTSGPRPIMIDGSNVAFTSDNPYKFSCKRLSICIKYFKEKGHKVTAFVPQFRVQSNQSDDPGLLDQLVRSGDVVLTPSKVIDGKLIVPYDDRFIVQAAVLKGGVIISRDNFKDLLEENPAWAETIKYRTLAYTWVDDVLMFPSDPLGVVGPSLEEFLSFN